MAVRVLTFLLGMLLATVVYGRIVPVSSREIPDSLNHNSTRANGDGGFSSIAEIPQQFMQIAQQAAGQGVAAGQQAAGIFNSILNAFIAAAMNAANNFSNFIPGSSGQRGRSDLAGPGHFQFPFPFPIPVPLEPGIQLPIQRPAQE